MKCRQSVIKPSTQKKAKPNHVKGSRKDAEDANEAESTNSFMQTDNPRDEILKTPSLADRFIPSDE